MRSRIAWSGNAQTLPALWAEGYLIDDEGALLVAPAAARAPAAWRAHGNACHITSIHTMRVVCSGCRARLAPGAGRGASPHIRTARAACGRYLPLHVQPDTGPAGLQLR